VVEEEWNEYNLSILAPLKSEKQIELLPTTRLSDEPSGRLGFIVGNI
jgi:hypothetical protein